jgi:hypothetical protein
MPDEIKKEDKLIQDLLKIPFLQTIISDLSKVELAKYVSIRDYVKYYGSDDILNVINESDIVDFLESSYYKVYDRWNYPIDNISEIDDSDIIDEVRDRNLEHNFNFDYGHSGDKLKRHLCDIVGCGYHQYTKDELMEQLKTLI